MGDIVDEEKEKKRLEAQKKRLKSLSERRHVQEKRKNLIAHSLNSAPSKGRIVFDSDDDELPGNNVADKSKVYGDKPNRYGEKTNEDGVDNRFQLDERFFSASESDDDDDTKFEGEHSSSSDDDQVKTPLPAFYSVDEQFVEQLKSGKKENALDTGFSFLSLMGREKPEMPATKPEKSGIPTSDETAQTSIGKQKPFPSSKSDNSLQFVRDALMSGVIEDKHKNHPIFAVDMAEIRSVASSFRQHNPEHMKKNWNKHRDAFVKLYKRQRKLALKELKDKKPPVNRYKPPHHVAGQTTELAEAAEAEEEAKLEQVIVPPRPSSSAAAAAAKANSHAKSKRVADEANEPEGEDKPKRTKKRKAADTTLPSSLEENVSRARRRRRKTK